MTDNERYIPADGGQVYIRAFGAGAKTPILVLHGGPGFDHTLLLPVQELARGRRVIFYDQLGSGKSDRPDDLSLWNVGRFVRELGQVREALGLDRVILLGASWGTILAVDYMLTEPAGVEALILSSPCLSARMWKEDADRLRLKLGAETQALLLRHEAAGTTASEDYQSGVMKYIKRFACRLDPLPPVVLDAIAGANMQVYTYMWARASSIRRAPLRTTTARATSAASGLPPCSPAAATTRRRQSPRAATNPSSRAPS